MSRENVELARRAYATFGEADLDTFIERYLDPDVEWDDPPEFPSAQTHHGHEGAERHLRDLLAEFDKARADTLEVIDCGDDRVLVFVREAGRGKRSGIELDMTVAHLVTFRGGKAARVQVFVDRDQALRAVGLSEQDAHADS
jgi:ketosteroid isomerase-like protein